MLVLAALALVSSGLWPIASHDWSPDADGPWTGPLNLSRSSTASRMASVVADMSGVVHVVWTETLEIGSATVMYTRIEDGIPLAPVDILAMDPNTAPKSLTMTIDRDSDIHIVYSSGGTIYHSLSYALLAQDVSSWATPQPLLDSWPSPTSLDSAVGPDDDVQVIYTDEEGVAYVESADHGETWSRPVRIALDSDPDQVFSNSHLTVDSSGTVHAVWVVYPYPEMFPPLGIRYAHSLGSNQWSTPVSVADGPYDDPEVGTRAGHEVHIVWSGTSPDRYKLHRWSSDGGESWSAIWRNRDLGGYQGGPALVESSDHSLHWVQVGTVFKLQKDVGFYTRWDGTAWSSGEVILGQTADSHNAMNVSAAVNLGNELYAIGETPYSNGDGSWQFDIFLLHRILDSPAISPVVLVTREKSAEGHRLTQSQATTVATEGENSGALVSAIESAPPSHDLTSSRAVLVGATSALVVVIIVAVIRRSVKP